MKYELTTQSNAVVISFNGIFSVEKLKDSAPQIREKIPGRVISGFVLDFTSVNDSVGITEAFEFIRAITEICGDYRKVAIVRAGGPTEGECFCAEISRCKGVSFEAFSDVSEAVGWLDYKL